MGSFTEPTPATKRTKENSTSSSSSTSTNQAQTNQNVAQQEQAVTGTTGLTTQNLTPEQQKLIDLAMPSFTKYAANPPKAYGGPTVAGFTPTQVQGQQQVLSGVPAQQQVASNALKTSNFLSGDVLSPDSNPALRQYMETAAQPVWDQLTRQALPAIRGEAVTSGQYGGSRQGIAEGIATGDAARAVANSNADIANHGYQAGLDALTKGLSLTGSTQQAQVQPGVSTSAVGEQQRSLNQALLDEAANKYYYNQQAPFTTGSQLASIAASLPGGSVSTQGTTASAGTSATQGQTLADALARLTAQSSNKGTTNTTQVASAASPLSTALGAAASILPIFL